MIKAARNWFRSLYDAVAVIAVLNFTALLTLTGYFVLSGDLSQANVQRAVWALRGIDVAPPQTAGKAELNSPQKHETGAKSEFSEVELDLVQREAERLKTEVDQRVALANSIMLKVRTERESFRKERDAALKQLEANRAKQDDAGFQKQLELLASLTPKLALEHLLGLNDPEKAAQILAAMDTDRAKKVVESAKRGDDLIKMKAILQKLQDVNLPASNELRAQAAGEP